MRELTKSVISTSWALSLFGAHQMAGIVSRPSGSDLDADSTPLLDTVAKVVRSRLTNRFQHFYDLGDEAQRGMVDLVGAATRLRLSGLLKPSIDVANPLFQGFGLVTPQRDWLTDWQELRNKIDIFDLVQNVEARINATPELPLSELVDRAYALGDFHALWAVEGIGHYFGEQALKKTQDPKGLLVNPASQRVPDKSLTMLNAGIGLSFAEKLLAELTTQSPEELINHVVLRFVELCKENTTAGYTGAALESLGLVTRSFHSKLLLALDKSILSTGNEELLGYFWHGVGRGTYFSRENFLPIPCCTIRWDSLAEQADHEIGCHNIIAGLAWAVTLVNMRTPQVMERLVRSRSHEITSVGKEAFANGVSSSIVMRQDATPHTDLVKRFCQFIPEQDATHSSLWRKWVGRSCRTANEVFHSSSRQPYPLETLFRCPQSDVTETYMEPLIVESV
ncbi:MAG: hypothetical protein ABL921_04595 [Pirellula sp.]